MLRATIEVLPFGEEKRKYEISVIEIANISRFTHVCCDYACRLLEKGETIAWAYVKGHKRTEGARKLVAKALEVLY